MQTLKNQILTVKINHKGAELVSLFHEDTQTEYIWSADATFWGKFSPVLFPIVGALKDNLFRFEGQEYHLSRHGFAREREFTMENMDDESVTFLLTHDEESLKVYPFFFEFRLRYELHENQLSVTYSVKNTGNKSSQSAETLSDFASLFYGGESDSYIENSEKMYFSVGGHPAFAVPLSADTNYEDYYLEFNKTEDFQRWGLVEGGLIADHSTDFLLNTNRLALTKGLFYDDAIVFKNLESTEVILKCDKVPTQSDDSQTKDKIPQLKFNFNGFPYLGIWAAKNANFVCIEPWCGIADSENHNQELTEKEGIIALEIDEFFEKTWSITIQ
jgi:galactose mutarotase-like enzyme